MYQEPNREAVIPPMYEKIGTATANYTERLGEKEARRRLDVATYHKRYDYCYDVESNPCCPANQTVRVEMTGVAEDANEDKLGSKVVIEDGASNNMMCV